MMALRDYRSAAAMLDALRRDILDGAHLPSIAGDGLARDLKVRELRRLSSALWREADRIAFVAEAHTERARNGAVSNKAGQQGEPRGA